MSSALSGAAYAYLPVAGASVAAPGNTAVGSAPSADPRLRGGAAEQQPSAAPSAIAASPADESAADSQSEQQAQIERQLSQVEAQLVRVTQTEIRQLASRDREVRAHEQAHKAVGGQYAGAVSYSYERGPDGRSYAVAGSVAIDTASVPGDPAATLQKLQQVQRAALAPAQPSAQDLAVAAQASQAMAQARGELATEVVDAAGEGATGVTGSDRAAENPQVDKSLALYRQVGAAATDPGPLVQAQA